MKKLYIAILLVFTMYLDVYAEWIAVNKYDEFTDKKEVHLDYVGEGVALEFVRDGRLWMIVERKGLSAISPQTKIEFRVDKNKLYTHDIGFWVQRYRENGTNVDDRSEFLSDNMMAFSLMMPTMGHEKKFMCELSRGSILLLRYELVDGTKETQRIPLIGVTKKIKATFGSDMLSECK